MYMEKFSCTPVQMGSYLAIGPPAPPPPSQTHTPPHTHTHERTRPHTPTHPHTCLSTDSTLCLLAAEQLPVLPSRYLLPSRLVVQYACCRGHTGCQCACLPCAALCVKSSRVSRLCYIHTGNAMHIPAGFVWAGIEAALVKRGVDTLTMRRGFTGTCLPGCLPACLAACLPGCLPACLRWNALRSNPCDIRERQTSREILSLTCCDNVAL